MTAQDRDDSVTKGVPLNQRLAECKTGKTGQGARSCRGFCCLCVWLGAFGLLLLLVFLSTPVRASWAQVSISWVVGVSITLYLLIFVVLFTWPLPELEDPGAGGETAADRGCGRGQGAYAHLKRCWMVTAYSFMFLALFGAVFPFTLDLGRFDYHRTLNSAIGVFRGCTRDPGEVGDSLACYPDQGAGPGEGETREPRLSWVLHIGGVVHPIRTLMPPTLVEPIQKDIEKSVKALQEFLAREESSSQEQKTNNQRLKQSLEEFEKRFDKAVKEGEGVWEQVSVSLQEVRNELRDLRTTLEKASVEAGGKAREIEQLLISVRRGLADIDAWLHEDAGFYVTGGLVIPLYLIVLSLIGGAVSLTRRIPEYQKQSACGYVGTDKAPFLDPPLLREHLVFQIIQFISAPFLAAVAYYGLQPSTTAATVILGFAAGFSSETVLLLIRAALDKLKPRTMAPVATGTIVGSLCEVPGGAGGDLEKDVAVAVVGFASLTPVFTDDCLFTIEGVPEGDRALEVIFHPNEPKNRRVWYKRVKVTAGKTRPVRIKFPEPSENLRTNDK